MSILAAMEVNETRHEVGSRPSGLACHLEVLGFWLLDAGESLKVFNLGSDKLYLF